MIGLLDTRMMRDPRGAARKSEVEDEDDAFAWREAARVTDPDSVTRDDGEIDYEKAARMLPEGLGPDKNPYRLDPDSVARSHNERFREMELMDRGQPDDFRTGGMRESGRNSEFADEDEAMGADRKRIKKLLEAYNMGRSY
jgi:hypothetical protein